MKLSKETEDLFNFFNEIETKFSYSLLFGDKVKPKIEKIKMNWVKIKDKKPKKGKNYIISNGSYITMGVYLNGDLFSTNTGHIMKGMEYYMEIPEILEK